MHFTLLALTEAESGRPIYVNPDAIDYLGYSTYMRRSDHTSGDLGLGFDRTGWHRVTTGCTRIVLRSSETVTVRETTDMVIALLESRRPVGDWT